MRAIVFAYGEWGCMGLEALQACGFDVACCVTYHDAPGEVRWGRQVMGWCAGKGIPAYVMDEALPEHLAALRPDFLFSFHYRDLLPERVLALAARGAFNLHPSLLPRYRGRAPVNWVLLQGEAQTGVTLHHMAARADAGDIVAQVAVDIADEDTAFTLNLKLLEAAEPLLLAALPQIKQGCAPRRRQDLSHSSYFGRRKPEDGLMDWGKGREALRNQVRALAWPYPGAFTLANGRRLAVWEAARAEGAGEPGEVLGLSPFVVACGQGALEIVSAQAVGGERLTGAEAAQALGLVAGARLGA